LEVEAACRRQFERLAAILPLGLHRGRSASSIRGRFGLRLRAVEFVSNGARAHTKPASSSATSSAALTLTLTLSVAAGAVLPPSYTKSSASSLAAATALTTSAVRSAASAFGSSAAGYLSINGQLLIVLRNRERVALDVLELGRQPLALAL